MKFGVVTKLEKNKKQKNTKKLKKFDNGVMLVTCDAIATLWTYGQFGKILKLDSRFMVWKTYIFINNNLLFWKT